MKNLHLKVNSLFIGDFDRLYNQVKEAFCQFEYQVTMGAIQLTGIERAAFRFIEDRIERGFAMGTSDLWFIAQVLTQIMNRKRQAPLKLIHEIGRISSKYEPSKDGENEGV